MTPNENLSKHYVARMVDGVPTIITGRGSFDSFGTAREAAYEFAKAEPGEHFTTLESANLVPLVVEVKKTRFTGEELTTIAPNGVYSCVGSKTARWLVCGRGAPRVVLLLGVIHIDGFDNEQGSHNTYELLDETIEQAFRAALARGAVIS